MKKHMLQIIVISFAALFLILLAAPQTEAAEGVQIITTEHGDKLKVCPTIWNKDNYTLLAVMKAGKHVVVPETIDGVHKITEVSFNAQGSAHYCESVTHLYLPKTIELIDIWPNFEVYVHLQNPFYYLPNLSTITIDADNPFYMAWGGKLYSKENHTLLAVAPAVSGTVTIEKEVSDIDENGISLLSKVSAFKVEKGNPSYKAEKGVLFSRDGKKLVRYPENRKAKKYAVPKGVCEIGSEAFRHAKHIKEVTLPSSMRVIGEAAFCSSPLRKIKLNSKLEKIEDYVFSGTKLKSLKLPASLRELNISYIPVKKLVLPQKLGQITSSCFFHELDEEPVTTGLDDTKTLVIKNPALDLTEIENNLRDEESALKGKTVYAYKGSLPYRQIRQWNKKYKAHIRLKTLKGKVYKTPKASGKIDTSWYAKDKDILYIKTPAQLAGLSYLTRKKNLTFYNQTIVLKSNLNMKKYKNFQPIKYFQGTFDGNGKTIRNLKIYQLRVNVGLFDYIRGSEPAIRNLSVCGSVTGGNYTGGIIGYGYDDALQNCSFKGKVVGYGYYGKLTGMGKPLH